MSHGHWDDAYRRRRGEDLSWYQDRPSLSLELIEATEVDRDAGILDVGGGSSLLVDHLLEAGYRRLGVLDVSAVALDLAQARLGERGRAVEWIHGNLLDYRAVEPWAVWHDRAVLHFLVDAEDRVRYRQVLERSVAPGGHVIVATFGPDGPERCSGLPTLRFTPEQIAAEVGPGFGLQENRVEKHVTPAGAVQQFVYARLRRS